MEPRSRLVFFSSATLLATLAPAFLAGACSGTNQATTTTGTGGAATTGTSSSGTGGTTATSTGSTSSTGTGGKTTTTTTTTGTGGTGGTTTTTTTTTTGPTQVLVTLSASTPVKAMINQGTAIGQGSGNGATPFTLTNLGAPGSGNTEMIGSNMNPFQATGNVPNTAFGLCIYPDGGSPQRVSYVTGAAFEACGADGGPGTDPMVPMAPFYFPLVYTSTVTTSAHGCGTAPPIIGLFDWRPKDIDEALVVAESDDYGQTWYFMQTLLELNPDYTNPISGGYGRNNTAGEPTGCPPAITQTNANYATINGTTGDDGWGHASIIQLPGTNAASGGQFLYLLDRNTASMPGTNDSYVDNAPLNVIQLDNVSAKFPIWNTNKTNNDIKSIWSSLNPTPDAGTSSPTVQHTSGLQNPDGIMAVFPNTTAPDGGPPPAVTVLYVQKILGGDNTGSTALPASQQCTNTPTQGGSQNHDISYVRLASTADGTNFTDLGVVEGLNDITTVSPTGIRWISPRGTLIDVNGDQSVWGLFFSGGNCLDGDSDAFHFIGYAESTDKVHWTVFNGVDNPIASINNVVVSGQTIPATPGIVTTQPWFAERLYAPTMVLIDPTHLSMTFAGYGSQKPAKDLLNYRQIGNVVLTVNKPLTRAPNNINAQ